MTIEELKTLSHYELRKIEDDLLYEREIDTQMRVRHTGGRFIILMLGIFVWVILSRIFMQITSPLESQAKGLLSFILFFVSLGMSVAISHLIWKIIGMSGRNLFRNAIHYWPITFYFFVGLVAFFATFK